MIGFGKRILRTLLNGNEVETTLVEDKSKNMIIGGYL